MRRAYLTAFTSSALRTWRSPGSVAAPSILYVVILVVFASLWRAAMSANNDNVAGYDYKAILWYLMATEAAVFAAPARKIEEIGERIGDGTVETELLRPTSVFGIRLATELGESIVQLTAVWLVGFAVVTAFVGLPHSAAGVGLAFVSSILGAANNWLAIHICASVAFWVRSATATWFLFQKLVFLLGGMLLPIVMLPGPVLTAAWATPFWTMAYAPGRLMAGGIEPLLLLGQLAWMPVLFLLARGLFLKGEQRLVAAR